VSASGFRWNTPRLMCSTAPGPSPFATARLDTWPRSLLWAALGGKAAALFYGLNYVLIRAEFAATL